VSTIIKRYLLNKNNKTKRKNIIVFLLLFIFVVSAFVAYVMHSLKEYTLNNTWVDLDVEVYTDSQGTSGSRIEKQKEMTGLMAGDVIPIVGGLDFEIIEIHPNGPVVIDVKNAYTHDNPMLNSVQHPKEISLKEGETKMLYWIYWEGHQHDSYRIKITVKANYYR